MKKLFSTILVLGLLLSGCSNFKTVDQYGNESDTDTLILETTGEIKVLQANKKSISILYDPHLVSDEKLKMLSNNHLAHKPLNYKVIKTECLYSLTRTIIPAHLRTLQSCCYTHICYRF